MLKKVEVNQHLSTALSDVKNEPHLPSSLDKTQNVFWETKYVFRISIDGKSHPSYWEVGVDIIGAFIASKEANEPVDTAYKTLVKRLIQEVDTHQDNRKLLVRWPTNLLQGLLEIKKSTKTKQAFESTLKQIGIFKVHPVLPNHSNSAEQANIHIILRETKSTGKSDIAQMNRLAEALVKKLEDQALNENLLDQFTHEYYNHRTPPISSTIPQAIISTEILYSIKARIDVASARMLYMIEQLKPDLKATLYKALSSLSG